MPNNPFTSQSAPSSYNLNPPADDGSAVATNEITWAKHIDKIGGPLKTFVESVNSAVLAAFGKTVNTDNDEQNAIGGSLAFTSSELTISSGTVTATRSHHTIDTEADAATDDLANIATGSVNDGAIIYLSAANAARTIVVKHEATGAGEIHLHSNGDYSLDDANKTLQLQRRGTDWYEVGNAVGQVIQTQRATLTTLGSSSTAIPFDDTIPQNTEGSEVLTVSITPTSTTSKLRITATGYVAVSTGGKQVMLAMFQDSTAGALAAAAIYAATTDQPYPITFTHEMTSGTASSTTFKLRLGAHDTTGTYINGVAAGRRLGGIMLTSIEVTEYAG